MIASNSSIDLSRGSDCREAFKAAYQNRYTWEPTFPGYIGTCIFEQPGTLIKGNFEVGSDLKAKVIGVDDEIIEKSISSQLWEVAIHRVRRSFEKVHGENTFAVGDIDEDGIEVIVGGKNKGDRYRIKDDVVTMVYRHIHGSLISIFTTGITNTAHGYLSHTYTSQYLDPTTSVPVSALKQFTDTFNPLYKDGPWVLAERVVKTDPHNQNQPSTQSFKFLDMKLPAINVAT